jgi:Transposase
LSAAVMEGTMGNCAGIDWASEKHDVLIEDPAGEELLAATFAHDEDGVSALCAARVCFAVVASNATSARFTPGS